MELPQGGDDLAAAQQVWMPLSKEDVAKDTTFPHMYCIFSPQSPSLLLNLKAVTKCLGADMVWLEGSLQGSPHPKTQQN